ncbi:MAG: hypothetical protein IT514_07745 [Burkholderiales bacterium]|nr:hypothetical protein [Burkholderiales bacterium]
MREVRDDPVAVAAHRLDPALRGEIVAHRVAELHRELPREPPLVEGAHDLVEVRVVECHSVPLAGREDRHVLDRCHQSPSPPTTLSLGAFGARTSRQRTTCASISASVTSSASSASITIDGRRAHTVAGSPPNCSSASSALRAARPAGRGIRRAERWRARHSEIRSQRALECGFWILSSEVAGERGERISCGPTAVIDPHGFVVARVPLLEEGMALAEVDG